jgi:hypothetical protein
MERAKLKAKIEELAGLLLYQPIQIHLVTKNEVRRSSVYSAAIEEGWKIEPKF